MVRCNKNGECVHMKEHYCFDKASLPEPVFEGKPEWLALYYKAWELAFQNIDYVQKEGWKPQLTCMPGVGFIWQWDSCFMTLITNYSNGTLSALNNLDNLYRLRRKSDGYMSMAYCIETEEPAYGERINPPLMAWAEWEAYLISGDSSRFETVLPALEAFFAYIEKSRTRNCGLYWFEDPGSSGMDNAPRGGYFSPALNGSDLCHIDLACQQALSAKCIADMYGVLGDTEKERFYKSEHQRICDLINRYHWSEKAQFYFDFFIRSASSSKVKFLNSKTMASAWTLLCGATKGMRAEKMIEHLFNPEEFYTKVPFASLSKADPNYDSTGGYWLGGVWAPTNCVAIRGIAESGKPELAREAAVRYLDAICAVENDPAYGSIWECYAPEEYRPATAEAGEMVRADFVGWSGLAPITMLIENIIGLTFNAKENTVHFRLFPGICCGLRNMHFNGNVISVECTEYVPLAGGSIIKVTAEKAFTLIVNTNYLWGEKTITVPAGGHVFYI